ncbi:hypothetical protein F4820DRAFT_414611 [Hypoxylon rubiginosum]|uniref:Uncharacterized protein n=1 Tax=Hypoxylon rubiginosum TaxID=110542 RepID=A0ACB9Z5X5_9PEZI|nr:hypothetical protein F4820DRAFT_414611 [Hypoxylon rubiginosum]
MAIGVEIINHSLYSTLSREAATLAGRSRVRSKAARGHDAPVKRIITLGRRGYRSSTRVGSVASLGNTEWDEYYRNDSLKYCIAKARLVMVSPVWGEGVD